MVSLRDEQFVRELRRARMELRVWTVDDIASAKYFQTLGVASLTTNRPDWLRRQFHGSLP